MKNIPRSADEARSRMAEAEKVAQDLDNEVGLAIVDDVLATEKGDRNSARKARVRYLQAQERLGPARERVDYLADIAKRLAHAEERLARDRREARWKKVDLESKDNQKRLESARERVIAAARVLVLESENFSNVTSELRPFLDEYTRLKTEFGGELSLRWPDLDYWRLEIAPGVPMHDALAELRGRKRAE